jgi:hypothetical protein
MERKIMQDASENTIAAADDVESAECDAAWRQVEALLMQRHGAALLFEDALQTAGRARKHLGALDERIYRLLAPHFPDGALPSLRANAGDLDTVAQETLRLAGWEAIGAQAPATSKLLPLSRYMAAQSDRLRALAPAKA